MGHIWSDENKFRTWLEVEVAATETLAEAGIVPQAAAKAIREKGGFDLARRSKLRSSTGRRVMEPRFMTQPKSRARFPMRSTPYSSFPQLSGLCELISLFTR
jgi:hypothetical protein